MSRTTARAAAMQLVYEHLSGGQGGDDSLRMVYDEFRAESLPAVRDEDPGLDDRVFIDRAVEGVKSHLSEIDQAIAGHLHRWTLGNLGRVDLAVMRLAVWELLYEEDVPGSVIINEAVELVKTYSAPESGPFVNGVLGSVLRQREADQP